MKTSDSFLNKIPKIQIWLLMPLLLLIFNLVPALMDYMARIRSNINMRVERIDNFKPGSFVLFNYVNSYQQWKGKNPIINWEQVNKEHELFLIEKLPDNWNLYEIRN